jgi:LacI family transcriptional regulator
VLAADSGAATIDGLPERIPVVQLGGPRSEQPVDDVRVDDSVGISLLIDHLVELGHRAITHVTGGTGPNAESRRVEYLRAIGRHGLEADVVEAAYTEAAGAAAAGLLLDRALLPTAVLCANDRCAAGLLATLVERGVTVPDDVSVVGFDDSSIARLPYTQLTTVRHDPARLASQALDAVVQRIEAPEAPIVEHRDVPEIVIRRTSGPARTV